MLKIYNILVNLFGCSSFFKMVQSWLDSSIDWSSHTRNNADPITITACQRQTNLTPDGWGGNLFAFTLVTQGDPGGVGDWDEDPSRRLFPLALDPVDCFSVKWTVFVIVEPLSWSRTVCTCLVLLGFLTLFWEQHKIERLHVTHKQVVSFSFFAQEERVWCDIPHNSPCIPRPVPHRECWSASCS